MATISPIRRFGRPFGLALLLLWLPGLTSATVFLRAGIDSGGEQIGIVSLDGSRMLTISAAGGSTLEFGKRIQQLHQSGVNVITELLVGYKTASTDSVHGQLEFKRYMFTGNRFWGIGRWRAGMGLSLHNNSRMELGGESFESDEQPIWTIDESLGLGLMIDYAWTRNIHVGAKASFQKYYLREESGASGLADANSIGLYLNFMLERRKR